MSESTTDPKTDPSEAGPRPLGDASGLFVAGRYRIEGLIARGGMATVYKARQAPLDRPVALKIVSPPSQPDARENYLARFRLEAETLASLDHPHIVVLHDYGDLPDDRCFLAMELVEGPTLADLLAEGPLEVERALQLVAQVAEALQYAHDHGVVHRDLKPANLIATPRPDGSERVKVVDFGLVKRLTGGQDITQADTIVGSPHCMSPEQIRGLSVDARSDVYSLAVLLYRAITGIYPFHGENSTATMLAHLKAPLQPLAEAAPDRSFPPGLERTVARALQRDPGRRYPDMASFHRDLMGSMVAPGPMPRSSPTLVSPVRRRRPPRRWLYPAMSMAAVVLAALAVGLSVAATWVVTRAPQWSARPADPLQITPARQVAPAVPAPVAAEPVRPEPVAPAPAPIAPAPVVPAPAPVVTAPTPLVPAPEPVIPAPEPVIPAPEPVVPAPEPVAPAPPPDGGYLGLPDDL